MEQTISVIIPVYCVEQYIGKCIDSLLTQTYQNLEIILVDDGSVDKSGMICDEYSKKDERIRVVHQENAGVSKARNVGLSQCTGEYITFVDPDDWIEKDMYRTMVTRMSQEATDCCFCGYVLEYEESGETKKEKIEGAEVSDADKAFQYMYKQGNTVIWNKLFKKEILMQEDGRLILFPEDLKMGEDEVWLANVLTNGKCRKVSICKENFYHWRIREKGAHIKATTQDLEAKLRVAKILEKANASDELLAVAAVRVYQCGMALRIIAYAYHWGEKGLSGTIGQQIRPYRESFYQNSEFSKIGKWKRQMMDFCMDYHFPKIAVHLLHNMTTYQK